MSQTLKSAIPGVLVALVVIAAAMGTGITSAQSQIPTELPGDGEVTSQRLAGPDRNATAVEISKFQFPDGADRVYLARQDDFPDALAAGSLTGGPILLVPTCGDIPAVVTDEITRLAPSEVIALGGQQAICDDVVEQAVTAAGGTSTEPTPTPTATETGNPLPFPTSLPGSPSPTPTPTTAAS